MVIEFCKTSYKYVSNITCNTNSVLSWDASSEDEHFIIIRTEYGKNLDIEELSIKEQLVKNSISDFNRELDINTDLSMIMYTRISLIGFKCPYIPARYYIFVCDYDRNAEKIRIYIPDDSYSFVDVGDSISFFVQKEVQQKKGLFAKIIGNSDKKKYIYVRLDGECPIGYKDGDLYYSLQNIKYNYPITRLMMKNGFVVPLSDDDSSFSIKSTSNGYNAVINTRNY